MKHIKVFYSSDIAIRKAHDLLDVHMKADPLFDLQAIGSGDFAVVRDYIEANLSDASACIVLYFFSQRLGITGNIFTYIQSLENPLCDIVVFTNDFWYWGSQNTANRNLVKRIFNPKNHRVVTFANSVEQLSRLHGIDYSQRGNRFICNNIWCCYNASRQPFREDPENKIAISGNIKAEAYPERSYMASLDRSQVEVLSFNQHENTSYSKRLNNYLCCFASAPYVFCQAAKKRECADFLVQKVFEILAVGSLLLCPKSLESRLNEVGLFDRVNCFLIDLSDKKDLERHPEIDYILDERNRETINKIRRNGFQLSEKLSSANKFAEIKEILFFGQIKRNK